MPAVTSSVISHVDYDPSRERLDVTFRDSGRIYSYFGVPEHLHRALLTADSIGAFSTPASRISTLRGTIARSTWRTTSRSQADA